jgi:hypothetical protein
MRVLFYLPVVTPWWFDHIVVPLVRLLAPVAEVRVVAPEPWSGTGIGARELARLEDVPGIGWTLIGGEAHPSLRTVPADRDAIVAEVHAFAPDYVLCRSADFDTPARFPGQVRYLMEGAVAPVPLPPHWIWLAEAPFDHGLMPALAEDEAARLEDWIAPAWERLHARARDEAGEPHGGDHRLCLALDYEHEENFFLQHRQGARPNAAFVRELAAALAPRFALDLADHPLNILHVDGEALAATAAELAPRVTLGGATAPLVARADGLVVTDSKAFALAALLDTPLCRLTRFRSAEWLNAYPDLASFQADIAAGRARRPVPHHARRWSAWHLANNVLDPQDPALTPAEFLAHIDRPNDPTRWARGMARVAAHAPELFA